MFAWDLCVYKCVFLHRMCFLGSFFGFFLSASMCASYYSCLFVFTFSYFILLYYYFEMTACIMIRKKNEKCGFGWVGSQGGLREVRGGRETRLRICGMENFISNKKLDKNLVMHIIV